LEIYKARYYWGEMDVYDRTILKNEITWEDVDWVHLAQQTLIAQSDIDGRFRE
jgi:hypothetical protein